MRPRDWSDGGATNIDELAFACQCDNLLVENGGWSTRKLPNGDTEWTPPRHLPLPGGTNAYHHPERFLRTTRRSAPGMNGRPAALEAGMTYTLADDAALLQPITIGTVTARKPDLHGTAYAQPGTG